MTRVAVLDDYGSVARAARPVGAPGRPRRGRLHRRAPRRPGGARSAAVRRRRRDARAHRVPARGARAPAGAAAARDDGDGERVDRPRRGPRPRRRGLRDGQPRRADRRADLGAHPRPREARARGGRGGARRRLAAVGRRRPRRASGSGCSGSGASGRRVAAVGLAFGMDVVAWSANLQAPTPPRSASRGSSSTTCCARSDVVSIHLRLSDRTRGLLGARELGLMRPDALLVNTSRGPIVDESALLDALHDGDDRRRRAGRLRRRAAAGRPPAADRAADAADAAPGLRRRRRRSAVYLRRGGGGHRGVARRRAGPRARRRRWHVMRHPRRRARDPRLRTSTLSTRSKRSSIIRCSARSPQCRMLDVSRCPPGRTSSCTRRSSASGSDAQ